MVSLGQRPNIKDKVHIETRARKGEACIVTTFDCDRLKRSLEQNGLQVKRSDNAGTSFCNELYWNGLRFLEENEWKTQMVFLHVPFEKHISDMEGFRNRVLEGIRMVLHIEKKRRKEEMSCLTIVDFKKKITGFVTGRQPSL